MALSKETARQLVSELRRAREELVVLRAVDATVQAFAEALRAHPRPQGASPDILWRAEQELAEEDKDE